ncbi:unnamed protein product [Prunus armeniaca]|uniref:Uncharacterized protein n=1 Tax=Prunus armeniaca TaxID=36596 RepID=A0A6J5XCS8_PRUAR|nr:unnamed protein product [Prunus armeniaca]
MGSSYLVTCHLVRGTGKIAASIVLRCCPIGRGLRSQIVWTPVVVLGLNLDRRWLAPFTSIVEPVSAVGVDSVFLMSIVRGRHEQSPGGGSFGCGPFLFLAVTAGLRHTLYDYSCRRAVVCSRSSYSWAECDYWS